MKTICSCKPMITTNLRGAPPAVPTRLTADFWHKALKTPQTPSLILSPSRARALALSLLLTSTAHPRTSHHSPRVGVCVKVKRIPHTHRYVMPGRSVLLRGMVAAFGIKIHTAHAWAPNARACLASVPQPLWT